MGNDNLDAETHGEMGISVPNTKCQGNSTPTGRFLLSPESVICDVLTRGTRGMGADRSCSESKDSPRLCFGAFLCQSPQAPYLTGAVFDLGLPAGAEDLPLGGLPLGRGTPSNGEFVPLPDGLPLSKLDELMLCIDILDRFPREVNRVRFNVACREKGAVRKGLW